MADSEKGQSCDTLQPSQGSSILIIIIIIFFTFLFTYAQRRESEQVEQFVQASAGLLLTYPFVSLGLFLFDIPKKAQVQTFFYGYLMLMAMGLL